MRKITKLRRSIKAISPIISVLLMIAIAVVASLVVYAWVMGYIGGATNKTGMAVDIPSYAQDSSGNYTIYVQNVGQGAVQLNPAGSVYINNALVAITQFSNGTTINGLITIAQGQTVGFVVNTLDTGGQVAIKVVTTGGTFMQITGTGSSSSGTGGGTTYQVTFATSGGGTGSTTSPSGSPSYTPGQQVTISATPSTGYTFSSWSASPSSSVTFGNANSASTTATINGAGTITATFTQTTYQVTFATSGGGSSTTSPTGTQSYTAGQVVPISVTAASGYTFSTWTATGSITFDSATSASTNAHINGAGTITATFTQNTYQVTFATSGTGTTSPTGTQTYNAGQQVTITATSGSGYTFSSWSATGSITFGNANSASTTATVNGAGTITAIFTQNPVDHFTVTASGGGNIGTQTAGTAFSITITTVDSSGATVTSYTGTNTLTVSSGTISPTSTTAFAAGVWTGQVTLTQSGTGISISTTGGGKSGTSNTFTVNPGAATNFVVSGFPSSITAGTAGSVTVTAKDANGNTATGYRGTVRFTSSDGQATLPGNYAFQASDNGVHTFTNGVTLKSAGSQSITATDTVTGSINGAQTGITVNPAAASKLVFTVAPTTVAHRVVSSVFTVQVQDQYGNPTTTGITVSLSDNTGGSATFYSDSGGNHAITSVTIASGSSTANFYWEYNSYNNLGSKTITASATGLTSATTNINVT